MRSFSFKPFKVLCAMAWLGLAGVAQAHNDDWFDKHGTPHGGQVRMAGPYHLEWMPQPQGVLVYVTDHGDTPIPTAGWTAQLVTLNAGKKTRIVLKPAGANTLRGSGSVAASAQAVLTVTPKAGEDYSARFQPAAAKTSPP